LEEYKLAHKQEEEQMEDDVTALEDKLLAVKSSLESRIHGLEKAFILSLKLLFLLL
jgi:hypothetical protein